MTACTLPEPLTPTVVELQEIAEVWREACGDPGPARTWASLSALTGGTEGSD